ncbi:DoxX family protein [Compostibacter hankyongensis]|uniref:DoxX family protein n=1 Tax=Compostibacter hankyongensis TaxID=1007089 RepID=A0ABP8FGF7_9BACT
METTNTKKGSRITGWILSILAILFLLFDGVGKLAKPEAVIKGTTELGYPETVITGLGVVLLISTVLYALPRVSFLGAVLLTGYLGGAVATHVRVGNPLFSHILFPVYLGLLIWIGLYLRNSHLRQLVTHKPA